MEFNSWVPSPTKFLSKQEAEKLLITAANRASHARARGKKVAIRDHFIIHLALASGLRVMEIAALNCGDLFLRNDIPSLLIKKGKGGKRRLVFINDSLKDHCRQYLKWKMQIGESVADERPLLLSSNTADHMTTRAIQKAFKRCAKLAGISHHYSIHCLRHTYACFLLKASRWNLRLVQKQLGHSRISTTQVYADIMMPDIKKALDRLYQ